MEIKKLFDRDVVQRSYGSQRQERADANRPGQPSVSAESGQDVVSISSVSLERSRISDSVQGVLVEDELRSRDRIEKLKEAIANGTYDPTSEDIARAIISFAAESNESGNV